MRKVYTEKAKTVSAVKAMPELPQCFGKRRILPRLRSGNRLENEVKYDINKDFTPSEEQDALKNMIATYENRVNQAMLQDYGYKMDRLRLHLCERARKMPVVRYQDREIGYAEDLCPVCEKILEEEWDFCPACGQALTWEDD